MSAYLRTSSASLPARCSPSFLAEAPLARLLTFPSVTSPIRETACGRAAVPFICCAALQSAQAARAACGAYAQVLQISVLVTLLENMTAMAHGRLLFGAAAALPRLPLLLA